MIPVREVVARPWRPRLARLFKILGKEEVVKSSKLFKLLFLSAAFTLCSMLGLQATAVAQQPAKSSASVLCGAIALSGMSCSNSNSGAVVDSTGSGSPMTVQGNPVVINLEPILGSGSAAGAGCPSQRVFWGPGSPSCYYTAPRGGHAQVIEASTNRKGAQGWAQFQCFNGSWVMVYGYCGFP